jgi:hypothetical protein
MGRSGNGPTRPHSNGLDTRFHEREMGDSSRLILSPFFTEIIDTLCESLLCPGGAIPGLPSLFPVRRPCLLLYSLIPANDNVFILRHLRAATCAWRLSPLGHAAAGPRGSQPSLSTESLQKGRNQPPPFLIKYCYTQSYSDNNRFSRLVTQTAAQLKQSDFAK